MGDRRISVRIGMDGSAEVTRAVDDIMRAGQENFDRMARSWGHVGEAAERYKQQLMGIAAAARQTAMADEVNQSWDRFFGINERVTKSARDSAQAFIQNEKAVTGFGAAAYALPLRLGAGLSAFGSLSFAMNSLREVSGLTAEKMDELGISIDRGVIQKAAAATNAIDVFWTKLRVFTGAGFVEVIENIRQFGLLTAGMEPSELMAQAELLKRTPPASMLLPQSIVAIPPIPIPKDQAAADRAAFAASQRSAAQRERDIAAALAADAAMAARINEDAVRRQAYQGFLNQNASQKFAIGDLKQLTAQQFAPEVDRRALYDEIQKREEDLANDVARANMHAAAMMRAEFGRTAADIILDFDNMGEAAARFLREIASMGIQRLFAGPIADALFGPVGGAGSGAVGKLFASVFHGGGTVGVDQPPMRAIDWSVFRDAPRLHNGLGSDEFAAILQRGERVIPRNQGWGSPKIEVHVHVHGAQGNEEIRRIAFEGAMMAVEPIKQALAEPNFSRRVIPVAQRAQRDPHYKG